MLLFHLGCTVLDAVVAATVLHTAIEEEETLEAEADTVAVWASSTAAEPGLPRLRISRLVGRCNEPDVLRRAVAVVVLAAETVGVPDPRAAARRGHFAHPLL